MDLASTCNFTVKFLKLYQQRKLYEETHARLHVMRTFYNIILANFTNFFEENAVFLCYLSYCIDGAC
jgi:hypothetical protein